MNDPVCKVCNKPPHEHVVRLEAGIAHAGHYHGGRWYSCSDETYHRGYVMGQVEALKSIIRSLRWHAGRLRNTGKEWPSWRLDDYTNKLAREAEQWMERNS